MLLDMYHMKPFQPLKTVSFVIRIFKKDSHKCQTENCYLHHETSVEKPGTQGQASDGIQEHFADR